MKNETSGSLLLIDDEPNVLNALCRVLKREKYEVYTALDEREAFSILEEFPIDIIMSDYNMPKINGCELLEKIKHAYPETIRMMLTGHADFEVSVQAINSGSVYKLISKPWDDQNLKSLIREAFDYHELTIGAIKKNKVFESSIEGILVTNGQNKVLSCNKTFSAMTGFDERSIRNKPLNLLQKKINPTIDMDVIEEQIQRKLQWCGRLNIETASGNLINAWVSVHASRLTNGTLSQHTYSILDVGKAHVADVVIDRMTYRDIITGSDSRTAFCKNMQVKIDCQEAFHVIILEVTKFNTINTILGIAMGDQLLCAMLTELEKHCKTIDAKVARVGDDEFGIMVPDASGQYTPQGVESHIRQLFENPIMVNGQQIPVNIKIGSTQYPQAAKQPLSLINMASGKFKNADVYSQLSSEQLYKAAQYQQFGIKYCCIDTGDNTIKQAYLPQLQWQHPSLGLLNLDDFEDILEKSALSKVISDWACRELCQKMASLSQTNSGDKIMLCPVSSHHLMFESSLKDMLEIIREFEFAHPSIYLVFCEHSLLLSTDKLKNIFSTIHENNCKTAIQLAHANIEKHFSDKLKAIDLVILQPSKREAKQAYKCEFNKNTGV